MTGRARPSARVWPILLALVGAGVASAAPAKAPGTLAELQQGLLKRLQSSGVPGASVVVIEDGRVVLAVDHGVADLASGTKITPETVFRAGSISKTFTAMAALRLVEDGRLTLQAPLKELLPEWIHDNPWASTSPVRLEHLLEHTAGLDDVRFRHYLLDDAELPLVEAVPAFGPYAVRWPPGSGGSYSNAGPVVVGRVIERVSGSDFVSFTQQQLFKPMGLLSARWTRDAELARHLSKSYGADLVTPEPFVETPARPSGSLNISARDLARLPLLLLGRGEIDGVRVLQGASVLRMETPTTGASAGGAGPGLGWGPGLKTDAAGRAVFHGHDGSIDGFVARFAYAPTLKGGYVVMANALSDASLELGALVRAYLERSLPVPTPSGQPVSNAERRAWSGQYQSVTPRQELLRAVIGLTQWEGAVFEGDVLRYSGRAWRHLGRGVFQAEAAAAPELAFTQDARTGEVRAHTHDGSRRKVPTWEAALKQGSLGALALALLLSLLMLPAWAWSAYRRGRAGSGADPRHAWMPRLLPVAALWAAAAIPLGTLMLLGTGDLAWLGRPTAAGWLLVVLGLVAPLVWLIAAWLAARAPALLRRVRGLAAFNLLVAALLLGWLAAHGWLGQRIWY